MRWLALTFHVESRWRRVAVAAVLCSIATACGDSTGPADRTLRLGRYVYTASHAANRGFTAQSFNGTMIVEAATPDSVRTAFFVTGFKVLPAQWHAWNSDAYRIEADPLTTGNIANRVSRSGDEVTCVGSRFYIGPNGGESVVVSCTLTYLGP